MGNRSSVADIPGPLDTALAVALAKNPDDRYSSAASFESALLAVAIDADLVPRSHSPVATDSPSAAGTDSQHGRPTMAGGEIERGVGVPRSNMPFAMTSFVGRSEAVAELDRAMASGRLVTLVGPGGIGKTRLALEVAAATIERFPDGVWVLELAPVRDRSRLPASLAATLGIPDEPGVPAAIAVVRHLTTKSLLLVVDNCEHVLEAAASLVDAILRAGRDVRILA